MNTRTVSPPSRTAPGSEPMLSPTPVGPALVELLPARWHRPLVILAAVMGGLVILNIAGLFWTPGKSRMRRCG